MSVKFVDPTQIEKVRQALNSDAEFKIASRHMSKNLLLRVGDDRCLIKVREGTVVAMQLSHSTVMMPDSYHAYIRAPVGDWEELLKARPRPFYNSVSFAEVHHQFETGGEQEVLIGFRPALARLIEVLREVQSGETPVFRPSALPPAGTIEPITGKYVYLDIDGARYRVYFEENGKGIPLLCQHTAGADGREWRFLLNDEEITSKFRVIAFDLPYHGKSYPPENVEWWKQEYRLTERMAQDMPVILSRALGLEKPVYIGVSIGGMIASDLAWAHPDQFRAVIACEVAEYIGADPNAPDWWNNPSTGDAMKGGSPLKDVQSFYAPEQYKRQNCWLTSQGVSGILGGDAYYYMQIHDLREKHKLIDTSRLDVYLMNGEWDPITGPAAAEMLGAKIKGAKVIGMKGLGHYPMCEDPDLFRKYLKPVLDEIAAKAG